MTNDTDTFTITIRKRPWWLLALGALWLPVELLLMQTAFASVRESEYRAATLSGILATVLAAGGIAALLRPQRPHKLRDTSAQP